MRVDLHCHTCVSGDSATPIDAIPARCREQNIAVQAITDHWKIWGAQQLKARVQGRAGHGDSGLTIIVGEEIQTDEGELIGLFLRERVEPGFSPEETVRRIKAQGGLVLLPHGFDPLKLVRLRPEARERIAEWIDIVETFNAHVSWPRWNRLAAEWAAARGKPMSAGSGRAHAGCDRARLGRDARPAHRRPPGSAGSPAAGHAPRHVDASDLGSGARDVERPAAGVPMRATPALAQGWEVAYAHFDSPTRRLAPG